MEIKTPDNDALLSAAKKELLAALLAEEGIIAPAAQSIRPRPRGAESPLSFAQQRLWFIEQLETGSSAYVIPAAVRLTGPLDAEAMRLSLGRVVERHEILRTTFADRRGQPAQIVSPAAAVELPVVSLAGAPAGERESRLAALMSAEAQRPFDLSAGPLLRARLFRLGEEEHVLLLVMHHIVSDGWSMPIIIGELTALYHASVEGRPSPLAPLPVQYADFAAWEREWMRGELLEAQLTYWKRELEGLPALELRADRPRPPAPSFRGATESLTLPAALTARLKALGKEEDATLFMTLLAAFDALLHRYTGQEDIAVGIPVANRNRVEVRDLVGFFVNTLVMRADISGRPTFRELLRRTRRRALDAYAHQDLPFERLVEELQPGREPGRSPLFQVMFQLQDGHQPPAELAGLRLSPVEVDGAASKFDLTLTMVDAADGLRAVLEYSTDLFEADTARRLLAHLRTLLEAAASAPDERIGRLPLMTEAERARLLYEWNGARPEYPRLTIQQLFEAQAERTPHAVALVGEGEEVTYDDLNRRANQLAHHLRALGVGPDARVGLFMERSVGMVVAVLGILKAGGAYVPLDPSYPSERLSFMLEDAGIPVIITVDELLTTLPPCEADLVSLDSGWNMIARESEENPACTATAEHLAYVTYTSGSTGTPKGVEVPHRGVLRLVRGADYAALDHSTVTLHLSTISFDASTFELWAPLLNGGRCVLWPGGVPSAADLRGAVSAQGVNTMWLTSSLFNAVVGEDAAALRGLNQLLVGGEALSPAHVGEALAALPATTLVNGYGPTEGTTFTCCHRIGAEDAEGAGIPVGKPIANTQVYVLDAGMGPVPVGVAGELYAGGDGLARGYLSRPGLTAERFVPHPFSGEPGARLYRTGDVVRWTARGVIEFLGRADEQVKIRGFRIEPGEVEAALLGHEGVREAVVMVREERAGEKRLVAYFVAEEGAVVGAADLRGYLRERLPAYMIPSAFVSLDIIPLTPNGKVDKRALPGPESEERGASASYVAPRTPLEAQVAEICASLLEVERVGVNDNFFDLGGHSLLATQFASRIRETFRVEMPLRALFEAPTVAELCVAIVQCQVESVDAELLASELAELRQLSVEEIEALLGDGAGAGQRTT